MIEGGHLPARKIAWRLELSSTPANPPFPTLPLSPLKTILCSCALVASSLFVLLRRFSGPDPSWVDAQEDLMVCKDGTSKDWWKIVDEPQGDRGMKRTYVCNDTSRAQLIPMKRPDRAVDDSKYCLKIFRVCHDSRAVACRA